MNSENKKFSPYKGLGHYTTEDAEFFFGRKEWRQIILSNLRASRITLLYGESGVGKSSVLDAGVVKKLKQIAAQNKQDFGIPKLAVVMFRSWSIAPQDEIVQCIQDAVQDAVIKALELSEVEAEAVKDLMPPFSTLTEVLQAWTKCVGGRLYIILDQFEDYFLYQPKIDSQHQFILQLSQAINNPDLRANIMISIRDESHAKLDCLAVEIPNIFKQGLRIERLNWEEGKEAIEKPIQQYNREFAQQFDIDPKLPEEILKDIEVIRASQWLQGEAGLGDKDIVEKQEKNSQMIETSCLQLVMDRLWKKEKKNQSPILQLETYKKLGRAENIVKGHVNDQMEKLSTQMQDTAAYIFHYLVTRSRTKIAHTVSELVDLVNDERSREIPLTNEQVEPVLRQLCKQEVRILRPVPASRPQQEERYEIFHDVLAEAILDWRKQYLEKLERERDRLEKDRKIRERNKIIWMMSTIGGFCLTAGILLTWETYRITAGLRQKLQQDLEKSLPDNTQLDKLLSGMRTLHKVNKVENSRFLKSIHEKYIEETLKHKLVLALEKSFISLKDQNKFKVQELSKTVIWNHRFIPENPYAPLNYVTLSNNGTARLWNLEGNQLAVFKGHKKKVFSVSFSPDGTRLATASADGTARLWDLEGNQLAVFKRPSDNRNKSSQAPPVQSVNFSQDGTRLATASADGTARLWDLGGNQLAVFKGHKGEVFSLSFSPDDTRLATASADGTARLWDLGGNQLAVFKGNNDNEQVFVFSVSFSPDGARLATASADGTAHLWDLEGNQLAVFKEHNDSILSVSFSQDGTRLATASTDGTARLWNLEGNQLDVFRGNSYPVWSARFSHDDKNLITITIPPDSTLRFWNLNNTQPIVPKEKTLEHLVEIGCDWLQDYLNTHNTKQEDLPCEIFKNESNKASK